MLRMSDSNVSPLQDRTQEIRTELSLLNHTLKMSVQKAIRIGQLLTEQKEFVGHGNFLPWIEENLDINERTARRYMALHEYRDKTDKLSDLQTAYQQIETFEAQERQSKEERQRSLISEFRKTGIRPPGWTPKLEKAVKDTDAHLENIKAQREKEETERQERAKQRAAETPGDDADYYYRLGKSAEESLKNASAALTTHSNKKQEWKEKIRLSAAGKDDAFMDAIIEYLETMPNDNRRIEACTNIIKICRNISVELQQQGI